MKSVPTKGGIVERHHLYWPKKAYRRNRVAWKYRNLPCNIQVVTHKIHLAIHKASRETPGGMPSTDEMYQQVDKCKDCKGGCNAQWE